MNCSICKASKAQRVQVSEKEVRWLCYSCILKNNNRDKIEKVNFIKASMLKI